MAGRHSGYGNRWVSAWHESPREGKSVAATEEYSKLKANKPLTQTESTKLIRTLIGIEAEAETPKGRHGSNGRPPKMISYAIPQEGLPVLIN